jgi:head-tail adaptor
MQAGALDRRILLRRVVETEQGGRNVEAVTDFPLWADKRPERGTEAQAADQVQAWAYVTWRIRWFEFAGNETPTAKWRVVEGARVYDVLEIREIGRREGVDLYCRTRAEDQA